MRVHSVGNSPQVALLFPGRDDTDSGFHGDHRDGDAGPDDPVGPHDAGTGSTSGSGRSLEELLGILQTDMTQALTFSTPEMEVRPPVALHALSHKTTSQLVALEKRFLTRKF